MAQEDRRPDRSLDGLAELMNGLTPESVQQIAEAMKGVDLRGIMTALGGAAGDSPAPGPARPRLDVGGALVGLSEVAGYFSENPLRGRRWTLKDLGGALRLFQSPNVQSLVGTARSVSGLVRSVRQSLPLLTALMRGAARGARGKRLSRGGAEPPAPPPPPPAVPSIRFRRPQGPPPVLEPWRPGGDAPVTWPTLRPGIRRP